jgi:hypothetical protein
MKRKYFKYIIPGIIFLIAVVIGLYSFTGGVKVTIHNVSNSAITGVIVHVTGNSYPVGDIPAGLFKKVKVVSKGESHIEIEHEGVQERLIVDCYFEQGYGGEIIIEITPDSVVKVESYISII